MRESKGGVTDRATLIAALKSCYPDARIRVGIGSNDTINFFGGLASYRSADYSVEDTLASICGSNLEALPNEDGTMSLYLDVKYRLLWFRLHRPNGKIDSEIIHVDDKSAVVCCKLYADRGDAPDQYVAKSSAQRFVTQERFGDRYLETAETAAMGRVLAAAGYGTQFCGAADMFGDIMVDAPLDLGAVEEDCSEEPGVASQVKHETKQTGTAQTATTVSMPQPAPATAPAPAAAPKKQEPVTLEDYLNSMTLEEAKNVRIDVGYYKGNTLGELALRKPSDLEWYVKNYSGRNLALKAGAILLVDAASKMAS